MTGPASRVAPTPWKVMPLMRWLFGLCALALLLTISSVALAQQALIVADYDTSAIAFRPQAGKVATFLCPSTLTRTVDIWGTDVYLDESPICTAAVHAGVLTPGTSGQVTIVTGSGAESFQGMQRNGVTSLSYGPWDSTYSFIKNGEPGQIDWYTTYDRVPDDFHSPITVVCPPKGNMDTYVWGTDVYRSDSGICPAAVHAGVITLDAGGRVTVTLMPKQETFVGSVRNGISTQTWTDWDFRSYGQPYKVTPGAIDVTAPASTPAIGAGPRQAPASSPASPGPRTIKLAGFTGSGIAVPIVPRTITLSGFSATGTSTAIVPRTIPLPGWTGVGASTAP
jgi:LCCL domain